MPSKRNILLINPWIFDFTAYDFWLKPLGLLYIASILKKYTNFRLSYIDCLDRHHPLLEKHLETKSDGRGPFLKEEVSKPLVLKDVPRKYSCYGIPQELFLHELDQVPSPDLILLSCTMTYWYPGVQRVVELVRKKFGGAPVILGGVYASLMPDHARNATGVEAVCLGPGEKKILSLIRDVLGDKSCPAHSFENLEEVPSPAYDLLRNKDALPLLTSRGCPFDCSFCASPLLHGKFEQRSPTSVISEIEHQHRVNKTRNFAFYDDALLLNKDQHILPILKGIVQMNHSMAFHTPNGIHVKEIDFELASLFHQTNFESLFLSQESFDKNVLAESCPKVAPEDLERSLVNLERAGYSRREINVYLMVGLPGQDFSGIKESILQVRRLGACPRLTYFSPVPGTADWQKIVDKGYMSKNADPLLHNKLVFPYLWNELSPEDFKVLKDFTNRPL